MPISLPAVSPLAPLILMGKVIVTGSRNKLKILLSVSPQMQSPSSTRKGAHMLSSSFLRNTSTIQHRPASLKTRDICLSSHCSGSVNLQSYQKTESQFIKAQAALPEKPESLPAYLFRGESHPIHRRADHPPAPGLCPPRGSTGRNQGQVYLNHTCDCRSSSE